MLLVLLLWSTLTHWVTQGGFYLELWMSETQGRHNLAKTLAVLSPPPPTRPQETTTASIDKAGISVEKLLDRAWVQAAWELEEGQTPGGDRQLQEPCAVGLWTSYFPCSYSM